MNRTIEGLRSVAVGIVGLAIAALVVTGVLVFVLFILACVAIGLVGLGVGLVVRRLAGHGRRRGSARLDTAATRFRVIDGVATRG